MTTAAIMISIALSECNKSTKIDLTVNCNGAEKIISIKKNDTFKCNLMNEEYIFTVKNINKNNITIEANQYGLAMENESNRISLTDKVKKFTIKKGKSVIKTQTTDYSKKIELSW